MVPSAVTVKSAAVRVSPAAPVKVTLAVLAVYASFIAAPAICYARVSTEGMSAAWVILTDALPLIFVLALLMPTV
jgi:hypothetical protein